MASRVLLRRLNSRPLNGIKICRSLCQSRQLQCQTFIGAASNQTCRRSPFIQHRAAFSSSSSEACIFEVVDDEDFKKRVLESDKPVLVDFHASWCGPCKILAPVLSKTISKWKGDILLAKVNIDEENLEDTVQEYKISAVPTVIAIKNGKPVDQFMGLIEEDILEGFIESQVGHPPRKE